MEEGKRIDKEKSEIPLPEAIIQHIQCLLSREEAARTTVLSKSWYNAWLTRPDIDLDICHFKNLPTESLRIDAFKESAKKTMQRYQDDSRMKINSFRLRSFSYIEGSHELIIQALKIGATDVDIQQFSFNLPTEVLGSETLLRLSVGGSTLTDDYVRCSRLKSLSLVSVMFGSDDKFKHIVSCCNSLEELSLISCSALSWRPFNLRPLFMSPLYELQKLRHLYLYKVRLDSTFFTVFETRFPCLKHLSVLKTRGCERVHIASTSLETITFEIKDSGTATFDVPNIHIFNFLGCDLPRFSEKGASLELVLDISKACTHFSKLLWFLKLKKLLTKHRLSGVSLCMYLVNGCRCSYEHGEVDINEDVAEPVVVENLKISPPASDCSDLLVRLLKICRPKLITLDWLTDKRNSSLDILCKRLMSKELLITPDCGIPDRDMFGTFGLKKVNVKVYEMVYTVWRPLLLSEPLDISKAPVNRRKIQLECIWE